MGRGRGSSRGVQEAGLAMGLRRIAIRLTRPGLAAAVVLLLALVGGVACGIVGGGGDVGATERAVGQLLLVGFRGLEVDEATGRMLREIQPGGVILFDRDGPSGGEIPRNIASPEQVRALTGQLQDTADIPYFIAVDAEGGYVNRLKEKYGFGVKVNTARALGEQPAGATGAAASNLAEQLADLGINWNLAPVVDVDVDPESPAIGKWERSFSADPAVVAAHAGAFVQSHRERGIITALKHFPGHGSAGGDTHLGITDVTGTYQRDAELAPYRTLIGGGYDGAIMTAHIVNRKLDAAGRPATLSAEIMTGLLRDELGFAGVVISDDMQMGAIAAEYGPEEAAIAAINAGVDVVLLANQQGDYDLGRVYRVRDALVAAVGDGRIDGGRIEAAGERVRGLKVEYGIVR